MGGEKVIINERQLSLSNLEKVLWPGEDYTKAQLMEYLVEVFPCMGPHLKDRPLVVTRWPDGINGKSFYQKNAPSHRPPWVETYRKDTVESGRVINYVLCNNLETMVWLGNLACIEFHPWLSRYTQADKPDFLVFDLDPSRREDMQSVKEIALLLRELLGKLELEAFPKTSGATGMHVYVPLEPVYTYEEIRQVGERIAVMVAETLPHLATVTRAVKKREGKVYVDYLQNVQGQTICAPYSPRPLPGAPVSTPLTWKEVVPCEPREFNLGTVPRRIKEVGDLFAPVLLRRQKLTKAKTILGLG